MIKADIEDLEKELWLRQREDMIWETKDGKQISLKEMTTEHIINAIKYVYKHNTMRDIILGNSDVLNW